MNNPYLYLAIGVSIIFFVAHLVPMLLISKSKGSLVPDISDLTGVAPSADKMLYYFSSPNCQLSKGMTPIIEELSSSRKDVMMFDISGQDSKHLEVAERFGVIGTPSIVLVNNGKILKVVLGAKSRKKIESLLS